MQVIEARNVAAALPLGLELLLLHGAREESRAGPVLVAPWPVCTVYERPQERVLFSAVRDANPFFHLVESLWMLVGRDDAALLNRFVADFGARFAESASGRENWEQDGRVHGAYGHRWRRALGFDQLDAVVEKLKNNKRDRQAVITMWDPMHSNDLLGEWKDRPCNTHIYLRVRETPDGDVLDITACCRSNDVVWGAYGANAVHLSVLQEYLATRRLGVGVGRYYQVSNNFHVYESELEKLKQRVPALSFTGQLHEHLADQRYPVLQPQPLVDHPASFDREVQLVLRWYETGMQEAVVLENSFLASTVVPALLAHTAHKAKDRSACSMRLNQIAAADWRAAMAEWIERRRR